MSYYPRIEPRASSTTAYNSLTVLSSVSIYVIESEEFLCGFTATCTATAVLLNYPVALPPI